MKNLTKKQKSLLIKIILSAVFYATGLLFEHFIHFTYSEYVMLLPFGIAYFVVAYSVIVKAVRNIAHGQVFDENFLMLIATVGAIALGEYSEAVAVMLFYQVGELFESVAVGRSRNSINSLIEMTPEFANIYVDGELTEVDPEEVEVGDTIVVKAGEKVPLDGIITKGETSLDTSGLTGESLPKDVKAGDEILSGCINLGGTIEVETTKEFENSTVSKIMYLVEEATGNKSKSESFITRFARYYTPCVVIGAVLLALVPSIITKDPSTWVSRALLFLVVSCPCALVISVPLSFFCAIGKASKDGILIKGSNFIELLNKADTAVFDKTGTLTKGKFGVREIISENVPDDTLIENCACAEGYSNHPIAKSIVEHYGKKLDLDRITDSKQITGKGVSCTFDGKEVFVGNGELMREIGVHFKECTTPLTVLYVSVNREYIGCVVVADEIKEKSYATIRELRKNGITETVMLTGDNRKIGNYIGESIGLDKVEAELLPGDKAEKVSSMKADGKTVIFTGDGMNDAPVLVGADVGIAMGAMGSDAAIEAADIVIMDDDIGKLPVALKLSRRTMKIVKENITFALVIKFAIMILGAFGAANMWAAVFADVGVSIIAILNALRLQK